jgi:hypothetical protein
MRHCIHVVWLLPVLGAAALGADELPQPKKDPSAAPPAAFPDLSARPSTDANSAEVQRLLRDLRTQREALRNERAGPHREAPAPYPSPAPGAPSSSNEEEIARLRRRMQELDARKRGRGHDVPPPQLSPMPPLSPARGGEAPGGPIDPSAVAQNYFRAGDYEAALDAYRKVPLRGVSSEERAPVMYMIASCLRKLGKRDEAAKVYREVAAIKDDPFVAECARWQLETMAWRKDMESQLAELRQRKKGLETRP